MKRIFTRLAAVSMLLVISASATLAQWSIAGSAGISGAVANYTSMAIGKNDTPYIAYADNSKGDKLTVKKFNGSSWVTVGSTGVSSGSVTWVSMDIAPNGNIYVGYSDGSQSNQLTVMYYDGSWKTLGNAGFTSKQVNYVSLVVSVNNQVFVGYQDQNQNGKATVATYKNNSWQAVGNAVGITASVADFTDLAIDGNDNLYLAYRYGNNNKAAMMFFNGSSWSTLGGATGFSSGGSYYMAVALDGSTPYVVFQDWTENNKATVMKYNGSSWSVVGSSGISAGSIGTPDIAVDNNGTPIIVYRDNNKNQKATALRFNGSSWTLIGSQGFTSNTVDYNSIAIDDNGKIYVGYKDNAVSQKATVMTHAALGAITNYWDGSSSKNWNTAANWSLNAVPTSSVSVEIPGGKSRYPEITSGTASCRALTIKSGASLKVDGGKLIIAGDVSNNGTFDAENGHIVFKSSKTLNLQSGLFKNDLVKIFEFDNPNGGSLNGTVKVTDTYIPTNGKLTTGNSLVLKSDSNKTARIAEGSSSGNYLSGHVTVEQYIPGGRRAFRFFGHPFSQSVKLSQLTDDIDITGQGGTSKGFDSVQVNAPSAFWFDVSSANNSTTGNNPGWKDFTSANTSSWAPLQMARIFVRGSKGQGLTQGNYTPDPVTIDMTESVNQGDFWEYLAKGSNSDFVTCGNPYASTINVKHLSRYRISHCFCVWNPRQGTWGGYTPYYFTQDYNLPAYSAFVTTVTSGSGGWMYFRESAKTSGTPASGHFKTTADIYTVELIVEDQDHYWDKLYIQYDDSLGMAVQDTFDFVQLVNPDFDFYTYSADGQPLTADTRPYVDNEVIAVGINAYEDMSTTIKVGNFDVPAGVKLYLTDKYLNKKEEIVPGMEYDFDIKINDSASFYNRFFINGEGKTVSVEETIAEGQKTGRMQLIPNPATNAVKVTFDNLIGNGTVTLTNVSGAVVYTQQVSEGEGAVRIPLDNLNTGLYMVTLQSKNTRITSKLFKQ